MNDRPLGCSVFYSTSLPYGFTLKLFMFSWAIEKCVSIFVDKIDIQLKILWLSTFLDKIKLVHWQLLTNIKYYTSDSLWKIWLAESIQSIHNSLWTWHDKCNICSRYCIYHVKFNVCLVTKPLGVFLETNWLNTSVSEDELCEKCIIKQLLNSVFAWYHELSKPPVGVICLGLGLRQITQTSVLIIHDIMLNFIQ